MRRLQKWQWAALAIVAILLVGFGIASRQARQAPGLVAQGAGGYGPPGGPPASGEVLGGRFYPHASAAKLRMSARRVAVADEAAPVRTNPIAAIEAGTLDRYLIRNATLTLEARDVRQAASRLAAAVVAARGYVSESEEAVDELGSRSVTLSARVPYDRFDRVLREVEALGKVMERQISTEDVTEEFVDSKARLRNLKRAETRLLEHLGRTGRLADVLLVEKELNRVRGEIEQLEGRLRFLTHRVAFSTFAVTLGESARPQAIVPPESFSSGKEASAAVRSLVAFAQSLWTGALWIGIWSVVWLPLALAVWLFTRRLRRPVRQEAVAS
jgi:hypothetical protein